MLHLLTVEQAFKHEGRGYVALPSLPAWRGAPELDESAELRLPDGRRVRFKLQVCLVHHNRTLASVQVGDPAWVRTCLLQDLPFEPEVGSEIWCRDDLVRLAETSRNSDAG